MDEKEIAQEKTYIEMNLRDAARLHEEAMLALRFANQHMDEANRRIEKISKSVLGKPAPRKRGSAKTIGIWR